MKKFFKTFMCCGSTNNINSSAISAHGSLPIALNRDRQSQAIELEILDNKEPSEKRIARINSQYNPSTLQCSNFRPTGGDNLRYNCPICFRFFDQILETSCCANYICHFCIEDLNMTITKADRIHNTRCPFCNDEEFTLKDVDPTAKPKRYTDSPCVSIRSKKMRTSSQMSQLSDQITGKQRYKTIGRTELSRVEDVATACLDMNRKDVSRFESEGVIDPEEVNLRMSPDKRCATEPAPVVRTLIMSSDDIDEELRKVCNSSVHDYPFLQSLRLPETKRPVWNEYFMIPEVEIGSEATPYLPNNEVYKKSYESESYC